MERKIILSRKGFDSSNGGMASPIFDDGRLISLPIPEEFEEQVEHVSLKYSDLHIDGMSYADLVNQLNPKLFFHEKECHLDPDIYRSVKERDLNWEACFGQTGAALSHLDSNCIKEGDIFLFFGWYKKTEKRDGKVKFVRGAKDQHVIFGYLEVGGKIFGEDVSKYDWHPHSKGYEGKNNAIYVAAKNLMNSDLPGFGTFNLSKDLVLTKENCSRSKWELPDCLKDVSMTYHDERSNKTNYFQSAMIGQEFIMKSNEKIEKWILSIVKDNLAINNI